MSQRKKLLFVLHEASRSGAPILLFEILKELQKNINYEIHLLLLLNGPFAEDLRKVVDKLFFIKDFYPQPPLFKKIIFKTLEIKNLPVNNNVLQKVVLEKLRKENYNLVFGMTIGSLDILEKFKQTGHKTILYSHELQFSLESFISPEDINQRISLMDKVLAGSTSVKDLFTAKYHIDEKKVSVAYSFVNDEKKIIESHSVLRKKFNLNDDVFIIGVLSAQEIRKGTDLVPLIAKKIKQKSPDLNFKIFNVGGAKENIFTRFSKIDAEKLNIANNIIYVESTPYPNDYINFFDCFLLPSREDPFPLVMHTASDFNKPVVAFKSSGGADEFLKGTNLLADYLDTDHIADIIIKIYYDKEFRDNALEITKKNKVKFSKLNSLKIINENIEFVLKG